MTRDHAAVTAGRASMAGETRALPLLLASLCKAVQAHGDGAALVLCVVKLVARRLAVVLAAEAHSAKAPAGWQVRWRYAGQTRGLLQEQTGEAGVALECLLRQGEG